MKSVSIGNARENLEAIVESALRGSTTVITRRGKEVAIIAPVPSKKLICMPDLSEFRRKLRLHGKSLSQIVIEQRRQSRY